MSNVDACGPDTQKFCMFTANLTESFVPAGQPRNSGFLVFFLVCFVFFNFVWDNICTKSHKNRVVIVFTSVSRVLCGSCGCVYWKKQASSSVCIGITTLNFRLVLLALWREDVNGAEMVVVFIFVWLFVIHVLHKLPEAASIDVATLKMVDSVLQRNVLPSPFAFVTCR